MKYSAIAAILLALSLPANPAFADHGGGHPMNNARIGAILDDLNVEIESKPGYWSFEYRGHPVTVISDEATDRMRIIVRIAPAAQLTQEELRRMMQANFNSALDARYAIARKKLWSAYVHPLSPLTDEQFKYGFVQAITLAESYGTSYSSGGLRFRGGGSD